MGYYWNEIGCFLYFNKKVPLECYFVIEIKNIRDFQFSHHIMGKHFLDFFLLEKKHLVNYFAVMLGNIYKFEFAGL